MSPLAPLSSVLMLALTGAAPELLGGPPNTLELHQTAHKDGKKGGGASSGGERKEGGGNGGAKPAPGPGPQPQAQPQAPQPQAPQRAPQAAPASSPQPGGFQPPAQGPRPGAPTAPAPGQVSPERLPGNHGEVSPTRPTPGAPAGSAPGSTQAPGSVSPAPGGWEPPGQAGPARPGEGAYPQVDQAQGPVPGGVRPGPQQGGPQQGPARPGEGAYPQVDQAQGPVPGGVRPGPQQGGQQQGPARPGELDPGQAQPGGARPGSELNEAPGQQGPVQQGPGPQVERPGDPRVPPTTGGAVPEIVRPGQSRGPQPTPGEVGAPMPRPAGEINRDDYRAPPVGGQRPESAPSTRPSTDHNHPSDREPAQRPSGGSRADQAGRPPADHTRPAPSHDPARGHAAQAEAHRHQAHHQRPHTPVHTWYHARPAYTPGRPVQVHWYHGVFVYGPPPHHHHYYHVHGPAPVGGTVAPAPAQAAPDLPERAVDRNDTFAVGLRGGSYLSGYDDGGVYSDLGAGVAVRYRPVEAVGFELAYSYHDQTFDAATERQTALIQPSVQLFAAPWLRVSPYLSLGATVARRDVEDQRPDGSVTQLQDGAWGPHGGLGLEFAIGRNAAFDLEARYIHYVNVNGEDAAIPSGLQGFGGLNFYF